MDITKKIMLQLLLNKRAKALPESIVANGKTYRRIVDTVSAGSITYNKEDSYWVGTVAYFEEGNDDHMIQLAVVVYSEEISE